MSFNKKSLVLFLVVIVLCVCFISTVNANTYEVKIGEETELYGSQDPLQPYPVKYFPVTIKSIEYLPLIIHDYKWKPANPNSYNTQGKTWHYFHDNRTYYEAPLIISFNEPGHYRVTYWDYGLSELQSYSHEFIVR